MRPLFACVLLVAMGCEPEHADTAARKASQALEKAEVGARKGYTRAEKGVRTGASKASDALEKAGAGARRGYTNAKARVDGIDWVQAFDDTKDRIDIAAASLERTPEPGPADAWWNRGAEAVSCTDRTCTVAAWFVTEARANPTRLMGDVKVLTALDDSGWLLETVRPGSAAQSMGFDAGDTIQTVDGHRLTDAMARLEVLATLRKASDVDVVFVRAGERDVSTLRIRFETDSGR